MTSDLSSSEYIEVMNLYARYNHASDANDAEAFASCFTDQASLINDYAGFAAVGRDEILALKRKASTPSGEYRRHWNSNILLEKPNPKLILGRCYLLVLGGKAGDLPSIRICGSYRDQISPENNEWKFAKRELLIDAGIF